MIAYRTLSNSLFEQQIRKNVKRISKKKRKKLEDTENEENGSPILPSTNNQNTSNTSLNFDKINLPLQSKLDEPLHRRLRRVSHSPGNIYQNFDPLDYELFVTRDFPNKKRRMSLPNTLQSQVHKNEETATENQTDVTLTNSTENTDYESEIDASNKTETQSIVEEPPCNDRDSELEREVEENSIWVKYLDSEMLFMTSSSASEVLKGKHACGVATSSSTESVQGKLAHTQDLYNDQPALINRLKKTHSLQKRLRNSFKGLRDINRAKSPVVRSKSDPPMGKSSFKSYIFTETLTHSTSTPSLKTVAPHHRSLDTSSSLYRNVRPTLHDIFNNNPEMADHFAIMIPKDPPPEWHKSLKFVIQKAGHKIIGKSSDTHQTTIPEHLKYQLKQIYVY